MRKLHAELSGLSEEALKTLAETRQAGLCAIAARQVLADRNRCAPSGRGSDDYLRPWSDKYDMPEYDLE